MENKALISAIFSVLLFLVAGCLQTKVQMADSSNSYAIKMTTTLASTAPNARVEVDGVAKTSQNSSETVFAFEGTKKTYRADGRLFSQIPVEERYVFDTETTKPKSPTPKGELGFDDLRESMVFINWTKRAQNDTTTTVLFEGEAAEGFCPQETKKEIKSVVELHAEPVIVYMNVTQCLGSKYYSYDAKTGENEIQLVAAMKSIHVINGAVQGTTILTSRKLGN